MRRQDAVIQERISEFKILVVPFQIMVKCKVWLRVWALKEGRLKVTGGHSSAESEVRKHHQSEGFPGTGRAQRGGADRGCECPRLGDQTGRVGWATANVGGEQPPGFWGLQKRLVREENRSGVKR